MDLRVLSLSTVFPNANEPQFGTFVNSRLQAMAELSEPIVVVAPVPAIDYSHPRKRRFAAWKLPRERTEGKLKVFHPRWFYLPGGGATNPFFLAFAVRSLLSRLHAQYGFGILDAHFAFPDGIAAASLARTLGLPYAVTLRGNEPAHAQNPRIRARMAEALRGADRVICVSNSLLRFAVGLGAAPERSRTIPNGIDTRLFHPRDRAECRARHKLPADARIVLSAGYLIERKGHHRIVSALAALPRKFDDAVLVIAGAAGREGNAEGMIGRLIEEHGLEDRVRLVGHVPPPALAELMAAADLFCLASTREGWPNVLHEAMGCGTPVVSTDVGAARDMVASDAFGSVVPVGDDAALRQAVEAALDRSWDRARIAEAAAARSWPQVAREVFDEFSAVVASRGPAGPAR